jgi:AmiR/NasT family two-component response regulator
VAVRVFHGDDNETYRLLIEAVLAGDGVDHVGGAGDPDDIVEGVTLTRPDIVLLDQLGDARLVDRVRVAAPQARIVILSGYGLGDGNPEFAERADAYLVKELDIDGLRAAILSAAQR